MSVPKCNPDGSVYPVLLEQLIFLFFTMFLIGFIVSTITDSVQLNIFTFSARTLVWGHQKRFMELSQPKFDRFLFLNSPVHNSIFGVCTGRFWNIIVAVKIWAHLLLLVFGCFHKRSIVKFYNSVRVFRESLYGPLNKKVELKRINSCIHQQHQGM